MVKRREFLLGSVAMAAATSVAAVAASAAEDSTAPPQPKDRENLVGQPCDQVALLCLGRSALAARAKRTSHADV
jgi:hypothetical protein